MPNVGIVSILSVRHVNGSFHFLQPLFCSIDVSLLGQIRSTRVARLTFALVCGALVILAIVIIIVVFVLSLSARSVGARSTTAARFS